MWVFKFGLDVLVYFELVCWFDVLVDDMLMTFCYCLFGVKAVVLGWIKQNFGGNLFGWFIWLWV